MRQAKRWSRVLSSAVMLAVLPLPWVVGVRPVAARATDVLVRCPNNHETYLNWPASATYSAGRTELQWRVLVDQRVRYWFRVLSPAQFSTRVIREQGGRYLDLPQVSGVSRPVGSVWGQQLTYAPSGGQSWLWIIVRPQGPQPPGQYLVTLQMQCDGPAGGGGGTGGWGGGGGGQPPCEGVFGQGC